MFLSIQQPYPQIIAAFFLQDYLIHFLNQMNYRSITVFSLLFFFIITLP